MLWFSSSLTTNTQTTRVKESTPIRCAMPPSNDWLTGIKPAALAGLLHVILTFIFLLFSPAVPLPTYYTSAYPPHLPFFFSPLLNRSFRSIADFFFTYIFFPTRHGKRYLLLLLELKESHLLNQSSQAKNIQGMSDGKYLRKRVKTLADDLGSISSNGSSRRPKFVWNLIIIQSLWELMNKATWQGVFWNLSTISYIPDLPPFPIGVDHIHITYFFTPFEGGQESPQLQLNNSDSRSP